MLDNVQTSVESQVKLLDVIKQHTYLIWPVCHRYHRYMTKDQVNWHLSYFGSFDSHWRRLTWHEGRGTVPTFDRLQARPDLALVAKITSTRWPTTSSSGCRASSTSTRSARSSAWRSPRQPSSSCRSSNATTSSTTRWGTRWRPWGRWAIFLALTWNCENSK